MRRGKPRMLGRVPARFAVAPEAAHDNHPLVPIIIEGLMLLGQRQRADGSWGGESILDRLICTCHCTMTLAAAGCSLSDPVLARARRWLCSVTAEQHNNSYWILSPLAPWYSEPDVAVAMKREIQKLCTAIDSGAQPHPDQFT